jgi:hypothetical protein
MFCFFLLQQTREDNPESLITITIISDCIAVETQQFDRAVTLFKNTLAAYQKHGGFNKEVLSGCKELADRFRKMLWPEKLWWTIQRKGKYAREYHTVRYTAVDSKPF